MSMLIHVSISHRSSAGPQAPKLPLYVCRGQILHADSCAESVSYRVQAPAADVLFTYGSAQIYDRLFPSILHTGAALQGPFFLRDTSNLCDMFVCHGV